MNIRTTMKGLAVAVCAALAAPAAAAEKVIFTLNFTPYGLHFGPAVAKARGLYRAADLDVDILRGYGSVESVKRTALGTTTFAMADATSVIFGRDKGLGVKQIATILDRSSDAIYFRKNAGIKSPRDLEGRTFGAMPGESHLPLFPVFAKNAGIDQSKISWVNMDSPAKIPSLMVGKIDAMMTFTTEEPNLTNASQKAKVEWDKFMFSDFGVNNYSIGIIASDEMIAKNPALVKKFLNATMAGYALAAEDPEAAANDFVKMFPETSRDLVLQQWKVVAQHFVTPTAKEKGLGYMTEEKMAYTLDLIKTFAKLERDVAPKDLFTMAFLERHVPRK